MVFIHCQEKFCGFYTVTGVLPESFCGVYTLSLVYYLKSFCGVYTLSMVLLPYEFLWCLYTITVYYLEFLCCLYTVTGVLH